MGAERPKVSLSKEPREQDTTILREITPEHICEEIYPQSIHIDSEGIPDTSFISTSTSASTSDSVVITSDSRILVQQRLIDTITNDSNLMVLFFQDKAVQGGFLKVNNDEICYYKSIQYHNSSNFCTSTRLNAMQRVLEVLVSPNSTLKDVTDALDLEITRGNPLTWLGYYRSFLAKVAMGECAFTQEDLSGYLQCNVKRFFPASLHNFIIDYTTRLIWREQQAKRMGVYEPLITFLIKNIKYKSSLKRADKTDSSLLTWLYRKNPCVYCFYKAGLLSDKVITGLTDTYKTSVCVRWLNFWLVVSILFTLSGIYMMLPVILSGSIDTTTTGFVLGLFAFMIGIGCSIGISVERAEKVKEYTFALSAITNPNKVILEYYKKFKGNLSFLYI